MHDPPAAGTTSDAAIIEKSRREPEWFAILYDRHFTAVYRYVASRLGRDAADDLTSEVFLAAFGKRDTFDPLRGIDGRAWLYGFAVNIIRRHRRDEVRHYRAMQRAGARQSDVVPPDDRADARLDADASRPQLADALMRLSAGERDVLLLVVMIDLSYAEVAHALGIQPGTVKSRLSRARAKLRATLSGLPAIGTPDTEQGTP